jgi:excisionase family DNA binding protein
LHAEITPGNPEHCCATLRLPVRPVVGLGADDVAPEAGLLGAAGLSGPDVAGGLAVDLPRGGTWVLIIMTNSETKMILASRWYTVAQVAQLLNYGESKVRMLIITGQLRSIKDGGLVGFFQSGLKPMFKIAPSRLRTSGDESQSQWRGFDLPVPQWVRHRSIRCLAAHAGHCGRGTEDRAHTTGWRTGGCRRDLAADEPHRHLSSPGVLALRSIPALSTGSSPHAARPRECVG